MKTECFYTFVFDFFKKLFRKENNTPIKFQTMGSKTFNQIFKKNDKWKSEHKLDEFLFGINDGDYFIQEAYTHFNFKQKNKKDDFQSNFKRIGRYSIENYIYDPIHLFFALNYLLNGQKLDKKDNDDYFNYVVEFLNKINEAGCKTIDQFIVNRNDYVDLFNDIISKTNDYFLTKIEKDEKSSDFKEKFNLINFKNENLKKKIKTKLKTMGNDQEITLNYFPILTYFKGKQTVKYLGEIIGHVNSKISNSKIPNFSDFLQKIDHYLFGCVNYFNPIKYFLALHLFVKDLKDKQNNVGDINDFLTKIQKNKFQTDQIVDEFLKQDNLKDKLNEIIINTEKIYKNHKNICLIINDEQIKTNKKKYYSVYFLIHTITTNIKLDDKNRTKNIITRLKQDKTSRNCLEELKKIYENLSDYSELLNYSKIATSSLDDQQNLINFLDRESEEAEKQVKSSKLNFEISGQKFEFSTYEIFEHHENKKILTDIYFSDLSLEPEVPAKKIVETFKKTGFLMDLSLIDIMENILK